MWEALASIANSQYLSQNGMTLVVLCLLGVLIWIIRVGGQQNKLAYDQMREMMIECGKDRRADTDAKIKLEGAMSRQTSMIERQDNTLAGIGRIIERKI